MLNTNNHVAFTLETSNSDTIILCIHGVLGSPGQFKDFANKLNEHNFSVKSILLPGHGSKGKEFAFIKPDNWQTFVNEEVARLKKKYQQIYLFGHSLGGLLALNTSLTQSINGIILLNTPIYTRITWRQISLSLRVLLSSKNNNDPVLQIYRDSFGVNINDWWTLPFWIPRLLDVQRIGQKTLKILDEINTPVLIIQSLQDETVNPKSAEIFHQQLIHHQGSIHYLIKSMHAYFDLQETQNIVDQINRFIHEILFKSHLK
ncbi:MAG: alpha/beta fold hydrolase [Anaerolineaceae bacterium]|nr:alpha/beta fold hydrolase [Anaerolineaceae bacterium]